MELLVFVYLDLIMGIRRIFGSEQIFEVFMGGGGKGAKIPKGVPNRNQKRRHPKPWKILKNRPPPKKTN